MRLVLISKETGSNQKMSKSKKPRKFYVCVFCRLCVLRNQDFVRSPKRVFFLSPFDSFLLLYAKEICNESFFGSKFSFVNPQSTNCLLKLWKNAGNSAALFCCVTVNQEIQTEGNCFFYLKLCAKSNDLSLNF